jgi:hypothetical protein
LHPLDVAAGTVSNSNCDAANISREPVTLSSSIWDTPQLIQCEQPGKRIVFGNVRRPSVCSRHGRVQVAMRVR